MIDIYQLEALAAEICEDQATAKAKLARLIRAFARILNARQPKTFTRQPTVYADEDGHWDNSYPPEQEFKSRTGPRALEIISIGYATRATTGGFYHDSEYFTQDGGLFITPAGNILAGDLHGTGSFGQFAAHPGSCRVQCEIEYGEIDLQEIPLDRLAKAEKDLRELAFPLVAARLTKQPA